MSNLAELRKERKKIQNIAHSHFEDITGKKHQKWVWDMVNIHGEIVTCQVTVPSTPSCHRWKKNHHGNLRKIFRQNEINGYRIK